ncbi:delta(3,5)-Delta(2,4)-dienoyl-CoA isomerase, mitochondrial-like [Arctopsyche grandis]|uniref:delta(3,5)-Delta(2,4)-dienoyl-CoA isomerase, mitochondrial-like n=1 Tax=Arctopsyche grandis TaxID=121162 RepID=UPI00406DA446
MLSAMRICTKQMRGIYSMAMRANSTATGGYETLAVTVPKPFVYHVELNRPKRFNAFNKTLWIELQNCFNELSNNADCRVIVISGSGKHFTAGLDLQDAMTMGQELAEHDDIARKVRYLNRTLKISQDSITSLETCVKPVISAVHSACIGAGVDLITASDIRYCSKDAWFQVTEVDIGMAADVGTLQRLPKVIGNMSLVRELCYTARKFKSDEALNCGLISKVFNDKDSLIKGAVELADEIAQKSPVAVQTTKETIVYSLDHTNQEGLDYIRLQNQVLLQSEDFINACMAQATKGEKPVFAKL